MDARIRQLLDTIVNQYEVPMEEKAAELGNPSAHELGEDSPGEAAREVGARARALDLEEPFALGLQAAVSGGAAPVRLNANDPMQSRMADALIQFLVRPGLASVGSVETAPDQFRYDISVDWPALRRVATEAGVNLDEALGIQR